MVRNGTSQSTVPATDPASKALARSDAGLSGGSGSAWNFRVLLCQPSRRAPFRVKEYGFCDDDVHELVAGGGHRVSPMRLRPFLISASANDRPSAALW